MGTKQEEIASGEKITNIPASNLRNKIIKLFTYLEKALSLEDVIIRDFRTSSTPPSPWWLADYPTDVDNLYIRPFNTEKTIDDTAQAGPWLRVSKKNIEAMPSLPNDLVEWFEEISPLAEPLAKEKIDRKIGFEDDLDRVVNFKKFLQNYKQGSKVPKALFNWITISPDSLPVPIEFQYVEDRWADHPELEKLLKGYIKNEWNPWAERVGKIYKANLLYDQLYALRLLLKNEGDSYELLLGQGLLTWQQPAVGSIYAPIFLTPLNLDFDPAKRTIEITPDAVLKSFVEISCLYEMNNPAEMDLITWSDRINANPFDFWHLEALKIQSKTVINYLSTEGEDQFTERMVSAPGITGHPSIFNAPVIFARKRNNDLWSKYAGFIRRDIEQSNIEPTEFIKDLIGEYQEKKESEIDSESLSNISIKEDDLFFPLPWNDEQKRIAERLDVDYGVVVKGPPGTGKSHTIANLISRFLAQGKSVLVTSQTSKALEVLRDKLPENIRSLAVSQLNPTAKRDNILQQSIAEISSNLGERHTKFSESRVEIVRKELSRTREKKAVLANQIRQYILIDSNRKLQINGEDIRPMNAAKFVAEHEATSDVAWFNDDIPFEAELNFSKEDLVEAYRLLLDLKPTERSLFKFSLPSLQSFPDEETVVASFSAYRDAYAKAKVSHVGARHSESDFGESVFELRDQLQKALKVLNSINLGYEQEIFNLCAVSQNEREKWSASILKILEKIKVISAGEVKVIGHIVQGNTSLSTNDLLEAISSIKSRLSKKAKLGTFDRLLLPTNSKKVLESYQVDSSVADNLERINILDEFIKIKVAKEEIKVFMSQLFSSLKELPEWREVDIVGLEVLITNLKKLIDYSSEFIFIKDSFVKIKQLQELSFTKRSDIETALDLMASYAAKLDVEDFEKLFSEWVKPLNNLSENRHKITEKIIEVINKKNSTQWKSVFKELATLTEKQNISIRLNEIGERVKKYAPNLYQDIIDFVDKKEKFEVPDNSDLVWKIARLKSWLKNIHDHADVDSLQNELERLTKKEYELSSDLVTLLAWQRQIDKVTKKQRDALMAWSDSMRKYGKGTGKYANKWLHSAQEALKEAKNAVPVWILPLHRAAQMFSEPKPGMFDVVIFDEASQCDIRGITIGYLGKKLLVVGDPDQISPAGIFQNLEKTFELLSRFLSDIPHKESFSITSSLFDLAKIRISNMIQLNEHFRSVPEIIAFSNHYIYEGKLKPLRHPNPRGMLKPPLIPIFVKNGYQNTNNKVNEPEANAIVEKLVELLSDSKYQKRPDGSLCTFGIISLLAEDQAKYIKDLILKHPKIGEKVIEERKIICGDAYAFQGDERDVMFLSMVKSLDANNLNDTVKSLTDKGTAQRFNVAATRARDQVFLYHSIPLEEFRNQDDWRFRLLNWFYNPKTEELRAGKEALKKEFDSGRASQFSFDVGNILIDKGYKILPEYPVIGRRIDLVIQGENSRLAVECDGDQYHTLEKFEEDLSRQRQLERAGWIFWRVSGSAFYCYKEKALDSLWKKLDELGIKPI